jgi:hypothetical protein
MLKEVCQFWEDQIKELPDGALVCPNGWSPSTAWEDGVHVSAVVWMLLNGIEAAKHWESTRLQDGFGTETRACSDPKSEMGAVAGMDGRPG